MGKKLGGEVAESTAETYSQAVVQVGGTGEFGPEILAGLDPTGVSAIVVAYAKPVSVATTPLPVNAPATRGAAVVANPLVAKNPLAAPAPRWRGSGMGSR